MKQERNKIVDKLEKIEGTVTATVSSEEVDRIFSIVYGERHSQYGNGTIRGRCTAKPTSEESTED